MGGYSPGAVIDRRGHASVPVAAPRILACALLVASLALLGCTPTPSPITSGAPTAAATAAATPDATTDASPPAATPDVTPAPTPVSVAPSCTTANLKASHGIVEGAAGSRFTEVVLVSDTACSVEAFPVVRLRDANGGALVGSVALGSGRIDLAAGAVYTTNVGLSNWCLPEPAFPLALALALGAEELPVTGSSFPLEGDLPECNGGGGPALQGSPWAISP